MRMLDGLGTLTLQDKDGSKAQFCKHDIQMGSELFKLHASYIDQK